MISDQIDHEHVLSANIFLLPKRLSAVHVLMTLVFIFVTLYACYKNEGSHWWESLGILSICPASLPGSVILWLLHQQWGYSNTEKDRLWVQLCLLMGKGMVHWMNYADFLGHSSGYPYMILYIIRRDDLLLTILSSARGCMPIAGAQKAKTNCFGAAFQCAGRTTRSHPMHVGSLWHLKGEAQMQLPSARDIE